MPLLEGFIRRQELAEIVSRWTVNRPRPGDVLALKQIVNFNFYIARLWVDDLAVQLLEQLHGTEPDWTRIQAKGEIKDFAAAHPTYTNPRIDEILDSYRRFPEDFYRETPVDGGYYTVTEGAIQLAGSTRIKRSRRIAEKGARRMVDFILGRIRANAEVLADERARRLGVHRSKLVTTPEQMVDEFAHAERRVIKSVKQGTIESELDVLPIPDVVGIKLIVEEDRRERLMEILGEYEGCRVIEVERHTGNYTADNIQVAYRLPLQMLRSRPPTSFATDVLAQRGLDPATLERDYLAFLDGAEPEVVVEIIVSSFGAFLESEIGRSMHEDRIQHQRAHPDYTGHLATNVRYFMHYLFDLCRSPGNADVEDVPIKLWVKYMPETIEQMRWNLFLPHALTLDAVDIQDQEPAAKPNPW